MKAYLKDFKPLEVYDDFLKQKKATSIQLYFKIQRRQQEEAISMLIDHENVIEKIMTDDTLKKVISNIDPETKKVISDNIKNSLTQLIENLK